MKFEDAFAELSIVILIFLLFSLALILYARLLSTMPALGLKDSRPSARRLVILYSMIYRIVQEKYLVSMFSM